MFEETLKFVDKNGECNYVAYLMNDVNGNSMKVAKFAGLDKSSKLIENYEYGYCSLIKAVKQILDRMDVENTSKSNVHFHGRTQTPLVNTEALKEAIINAAVHNDYTNEIPPVVIIYSDRIEITSIGGLPVGITQDDFFDGASRPRNPGLMRVFLDLNLVEQLGTGLNKITSVYGKEAFHFYRDHIIVVLPFDKSGTVNGTVNAESGTVNEAVYLNSSEKTVLGFIGNDKAVTAETLTAKTGKGMRTIERALKSLQDKGVIKRAGSDKKGHWVILK